MWRQNNRRQASLALSLRWVISHHGCIYSSRRFLLINARQEVYLDHETNFPHADYRYCRLEAMVYNERNNEERISSTDKPLSSIVDILTDCD